MYSIFYHTNELDIVHNDDVGFIINRFNYDCYGTLKKLTGNKYHFAFSEESMNYFIVDADSFDSAFEAAITRLKEVVNFRYSELNVDDKYHFNYFDWIELAEYLNIDIEDWTEYEISFMILEYLYNNKEQLIPVFKEFALKVSSNEYIEPMIKGMCEIENDLSFYSAFQTQLRRLWN